MAIRSRTGPAGKPHDEKVMKTGRLELLPILVPDGRPLFDKMVMDKSLVIHGLFGMVA